MLLARGLGFSMEVVSLLFFVPTFCLIVFFFYPWSWEILTITRETLQLETYFLGIRFSKEVLPRRSLQTIEFHPGYRIDTPRSETDDDIVPARLVLAGGNQQLVLTQRNLSRLTDLEQLAYFLGQYLGKRVNRFPERSQGSSRPHH